MKPYIFKIAAIAAVIGVVLIVAGVVNDFSIPIINKPIVLPESVMLAVPFSPQAPSSNWDRNEDCEETSITMAGAFLSGNHMDRLPPGETQESINHLRSWEQKNLGYNANTGSDATKRLAEGAFGLHVEQVSDYSADDLKRALAARHVILLPVNAKILNPEQYEKNGPLYHMIVVRGYRGDDFIVNDPGTNGGEANVYSFKTLKASAADWNQAAKILEPNKKIALIVSR